MLGRGSPVCKSTVTKNCGKISWKHFVAGHKMT